MYNNTITININQEVIGIPIDECFMCGDDPNITRHHAIPQEYNPKRNITIPLCEKHKNTTHHLIKELYIPKGIRNKLGRGLKELNALNMIIKSLRKDFDIKKMREYNAQQSNHR